MGATSSRRPATLGPSPQPGRGESPAVEPADLSIGIVVPVFNEVSTLEAFLARLREVAGRCPIVVVDGGSTDGSARIGRQFFQTKVVELPNRGGQLNHGAHFLGNDVLLFLHADSQLPRGFDYYVRGALQDPRVAGGCFRLEFDVPHPLLRFYCWFTRFPGRFFHFGDQGFFVRREVFWSMGGFRSLPLLEDVDFLRRLRRYGRFVTLPVPVVTSARRFLQRGVLRQQLANILLVAQEHRIFQPRAKALEDQMSWIKVIPPAEASGELAEQYSTMQDADGNVANILTVHSLNPGALRGHYDLYKTVMFGPSELSRAQREMIAVVVSSTNRCHY